LSYTARMSKVNTGDIRWLECAKPPMARVLAAVAEEFGFSLDALRHHGRAVGLGKAVAAELCCRLSGESQRAAATHLGYRHESAVGKQRQLLRRLLAHDPALARSVVRIETACRNF
jgi:hypothetical protein